MIMGVWAREGLCIHKRVIGSERASIAEIAQGPVCCAEPGARDHFWRYAICESYPWREELLFFADPNVRLETQSNAMLLAVSRELNAAERGTPQPCFDM